MRESAQAALSVLKNRASSLGIDSVRFAKLDIHIHVPAGATPRDSPSSGVAMFVALVSLLTGRNVRNDTAVTGFGRPFARRVREALGCVGHTPGQRERGNKTKTKPRSIALPVNCRCACRSRSFCAAAPRSGSGAEELG